MQLEFESGKIIKNASEADLHNFLRGEAFTVLSVTAGTYIQCAEQNSEPWEYVLEYQEEDPDHHYRAVGPPIPLAKVIAAFGKYLRGDASWKNDFPWEKMTL